MGFGAALGAVGALGGMFGGGGDNGADSARRDQRDYLHRLGLVGDKFGDLAHTGIGDYNYYDGQKRLEIGNLADYLKRNPYTDQRDAADLAQSTAGMTSAWQRAIADTQSGLANSGLSTSTSATPSSVGAGQSAYLQAQQANQMGQAQNQLAQQKIADRLQRMSSLVGLYGDASNNAYNQGSGALGNQGQIYNNLGEQYGNLANYLDAQQQSQSQDFLGGLGQAGQLFNYIGSYNKARKGG